MADTLVENVSALATRVGTEIQTVKADLETVESTVEELREAVANMTTALSAQTVEQDNGNGGITLDVTAGTVFCCDVMSIGNGADPFVVELENADVTSGTAYSVKLCLFNMNNAYAMGTNTYELPGTVIGTVNPESSAALIEIMVMAEGTYSFVLSQDA